MQVLGAAHPRDPFSLLAYPWKWPGSHPLQSAFALLLRAEEPVPAAHPGIVPGETQFTWEQRVALHDLSLGMGRQKLKLLTFRQRKNNPFIGQEYSGYLQMMLNRSSSSSGSVFPVPGSRGRIRAKIFVPHAASSALGLLPSGKAATCSQSCSESVHPGVPQSWLFPFLNLHPASSSPARNKRAQNDIWKGQIWF